jgi:class 3 adenylate cyclase
LQNSRTARRIAELIETPLRLRIGISSGSVVAGVTGRSKFSYDLWGDPVNMAARMESSGVPSEIQASPGVWAFLNNKFSFEARGPQDIKGKG